MPIVTAPTCRASPFGKLAQSVELFARAVGRMIMSQAFLAFPDAERLASLAALAPDTGW